MSLFDKYTEQIKGITDNLQKSNEHHLNTISERLKEIEDPKTKAFILQSLESAKKGTLNIDQFIKELNTHASRSSSNK